MFKNWLISCTVVVTLHVSVWVEIQKNRNRIHKNLVTLHVSVWVEMDKYLFIRAEQKGHAPRERVSWNCRFCQIEYLKQVTLHVSVWVEMGLPLYSSWYTVVTLHVSVWVEIGSLHTLSRKVLVTLHVSVWVEICLSCVFLNLNESRSTWACELKCYQLQRYQEQQSRHAPRERVSWNCKKKARIWYCMVTLHVSVWVEIGRSP